MTESPSSAASPARQAMTVMQTADRAYLATSQAGWPFASLVLAALDSDGTPMLLISNLSEHSKNIA
ncbi:MAG TPA: heme iron utilization protein, partial [Stellaceae bacterium]|nr:heme iron utilization protein [Stellaceae bacterium]